MLLIAAGGSLFAQDAKPKHSPFGCSEGAVSVDLDKEPALRFRLLDRYPEGPNSYSKGHEFSFTGDSPFPYIKVFLTATVPEASVGTSSEAQLTLYAQTAESSADYHSGRNTQWWKLESTAGSDSDARRGSITLTFEASQIAGCFNGGGASDCSFADVVLATPNNEVPLISVGFTKNLGGANAANWVAPRLLLDFRSSPPRVAITADCSYNEGGGACTAYDSQQMQRTNLRCDWKGDARDFLCAEESAPEPGGHSDFYLFGDNDALLRTDEIASFSDALLKFKTADTKPPLRLGASAQFPGSTS